VPVVLTAGSVLAVALANVPLAWDGSYFLFTVLNDQQTLLIYHRRVESVLTAPVVAAAAVTDDVSVLRTVFCVMYAAVPLVAIGCSWAVVRRRRPDLFVWPIIGIALALLPGRAVAFAESLIAAQLIWPLMLAGLVGVERRPLLLFCLPIAAIVATSHPIGALFLLIVGAIGFVEARSRISSIVWLGSFVALAALNVAELGSRLAPYEVASLRPEAVAFDLLRSSVGPQMAGLMLIALAAWLVHRGATTREERSAERIHRRALVTIALSAMPLLIWAAVPAMWRDEIGFRVWALPATLPLFALAWIDARRTRLSAGSRLLERRAVISALAAVVMFVVLVVQSASWATLVANVRTAVEGRSGCVPAGSIESYPDSALGDWEIVTLSIVLQDRDVSAFVAPAEVCTSSAWPGEVAVGALTVLRPRWFRFH
jgi:hypothetical protein